ncbi:hypothetical protein [Singulisphaera acidiphila]|nr:hypothetical protein [Singulisphaera acidiphila]
MNRLPQSAEILSRRPEWLEGTWITLADGQAWSFPPPTAIPGYQEIAHDAAREAVDNILPLLNVDAIRRQVGAIATGDPSGVLRGLGQMFALYQIAFRLGSILLRHNYNATDADCDLLMPFNYQLGDLPDPQSRIHKTTPEILAMSNAIAASIGVDIGPELARIVGSN